MFWNEEELVVERLRLRDLLDILEMDCLLHVEPSLQLHVRMITNFYNYYALQRSIVASMTNIRREKTGSGEVVGDVTNAE
ncbi:hypothetical protein ABG067_007838, partial [Albugo candida]